MATSSPPSASRMRASPKRTLQFPAAAAASTIPYGQARGSRLFASAIGDAPPACSADTPGDDVVVVLRGGAQRALPRIMPTPELIASGTGAARMASPLAGSHQGVHMRSHSRSNISDTMQWPSSAAEDETGASSYFGVQHPRQMPSASSPTGSPPRMSRPSARGSPGSGSSSKQRVGGGSGTFSLVSAHRHSVSHYTSSAGGGADGSAPVDRFLEQRASFIPGGAAGSGGALHVAQVEEDRVEGVRRATELCALGERSKSVAHTHHARSGEWSTEVLRANLGTDGNGGHEEAFERDWNAASPVLAMASSPIAALRSPASVHATANYTHEQQLHGSPSASPVRRVERRSHSRQFHVDAHGNVLPTVVGVSATKTTPIGSPTSAGALPRRASGPISGQPLRSPVRSPGSAATAASIAVEGVRQSPKTSAAASPVASPMWQRQQRGANIRSAPASGGAKQ